MINKKSFCDIMNALRDHWDNILKFEKIMHANIEGFPVTISDAIMNALVQDLEKVSDPRIDPMIYDFAFDLDWGRSEDAATAVTVNDEPYDLTSADRLYDFLIEQGEDQ